MNEAKIKGLRNLRPPWMRSIKPKLEVNRRTKGKGSQTKIPVTPPMGERKRNT